MLAELELANAVSDKQRRAAHCAFTAAEPATPGVETAAVQDLTRAPDAITPPTAQHAQRQAITAARDMARRLRGQPPRPYRHRDLGLAVDLGGPQAVSRPLGRYLSGVPAQVVTRGYHLYALPPPRARVRTAADWLMHTALGDNFARLVLPDPMHGTLTGQEATGQYLSGGDARQTAARILAHDQEGWLRHDRPGEGRRRPVTGPGGDRGAHATA